MLTTCGQAVIFKCSAAFSVKKTQTNLAAWHVLFKLVRCGRIVSKLAQPHAPLSRNVLSTCDKKPCTTTSHASLNKACTVVVQRLQVNALSVIESISARPELEVQNGDARRPYPSVFPPLAVKHVVGNKETNHTLAPADYESSLHGTTGSPKQDC
jgi:hypothetical protein